MKIVRPFIIETDQIHMLVRVINQIKVHTKLRKSEKIDHLWSRRGSRCQEGGKTSSHHHIGRGEEGGGSSNIIMEKNMGFVPLFSRATAGFSS